MIKKRKTIQARIMRILSVTILALLSVSCLNEEMPYLSLDAEPEVEVGYESETLNIGVNSNLAWLVSSDATWCAVSKGKGSYAGEFTVSIEENETPETRRAVVTVTAESLVKTVTIVQAPNAPDFKLSASEVAFINKAETYRLLITSNHPWKAVSSSAWCKINPAEGKGDGEMEIIVDDNTSGEDREAKITFVVEADGKPEMKTLSVRQSANAYYLELPITEYYISKNEAVLDIAYLLNGNEIGIQCETNASWVTLDHAADGRAVFNVAKNSEGKTRNAILSFNTTGQPGKPEIRQVTLEQSGVENELDLLVSEIELQAGGEEIVLRAETNTELEVESSSEWCTASVKDGKVTISAEANTTKADRKAYVTVFTANAEGNRISKAITVTQVAKSEQLELPLRRFSVSKAEATLSIPYIAGSPETQVQCTGAADWLTLTEIGTGYAVFKVAKNTGSKPRTATVAFVATGGAEPIIRKATVTQEAVENELDLLVSEHALSPDGDEETRIPFTANTEVDIKSSSGWCTAKIQGSDIVVSAEMNFTGYPRTGYVTLTTKTSEGEVLVKTLTVRQESIEPKFSFEQSTHSVSYDAGTSYVQLSSTGAWKLNNSDGEIPAWLTISPKEGEGDRLLTVTVIRNQFSKERKTQLSFTNTLLEKSISLEIIQAGDPNGIENYKYLGSGYDASGEYASDKDVRASVLDIDKLLNKGYIADVLNLNSTEERYIYGKTIETYQENLSQTASISGGFKAFSASVSNSFSKETLSSEENEYASFRHITKKQSYVLQRHLKPEDLKNCVIDEVQKDIDTMEPDALFRKYGTHVIAGFILGGSLDYAMSADVSTMSSAVDWSVAVSAGFKLLSAGVETSVGYGEYEKMSRESSNFESTLRARGGESQYASQNPNVSESTYNEWLASLADKNKWVMVDFDGSELIPIWNFASTAARKQTLTTAAQKYLTSPSVEKVTTHRKVKISVNKVGYTSDDAGDTAEMEYWFYYSLNNGKQTKFGYIEQEMDDEQDDNPSDWPYPNATINFTRESLSIYKEHKLVISMESKEDDVTDSDWGEGSKTLYYNPQDLSWHLDSKDGPSIGTDGYFTINSGGARAQYRLEWFK